MPTLRTPLKDQAIQARHETSLCAATVILSGFLESFLRELAEEMITDICNRGFPSTSSSKIRITHYWDGARNCARLARQEKAESPVVLSEGLRCARRLASVGGPQLPYEISGRPSPRRKRILDPNRSAPS